MTRRYTPRELWHKDVVGRDGSPWGKVQAIGMDRVHAVTRIAVHAAAAYHRLRFVPVDDIVVEVDRIVVPMEGRLIVR